MSGGSGNIRNFFQVAALKSSGSKSNITGVSNEVNPQFKFNYEKLQKSQSKGPTIGNIKEAKPEPNQHSQKKAIRLASKKLTMQERPRQLSLNYQGKQTFAKVQHDGDAEMLNEEYKHTIGSSKHPSKSPLKSPHKKEVEDKEDFIVRRKNRRPVLTEDDSDQDKVQTYTNKKRGKLNDGKVDILQEDFAGNIKLRKLNDESAQTKTNLQNSQQTSSKSSRALPEIDQLQFNSQKSIRKDVTGSQQMIQSSQDSNKQRGAAQITDKNQRPLSRVSNTSKAQVSQKNTQNSNNDAVYLSEGELVGCLDDNNNTDQIQAPEKALSDKLLSFNEGTKPTIQQKLELSEIDTRTVFRQAPIPIQNSSMTKSQSHYQNSQKGTVAICQQSGRSSLKVTLAQNNGTNIEVLSSQAVFAVFQKKENFKLLCSVGKIVEITELNPAKEQNKFWITNKTQILVHADDRMQCGAIGARHKSKEEEKQAQLNIEILQTDQIKYVKVPGLFELTSIGDISFNVFELKFPQSIYVYSRDVVDSILPIEKWVLGTLCFSKHDNGNTLKDNIGNSLTVLSNTEYLKLFGRLALRQAFVSNGSDIVKVNGTQFFTRANFKAYLFNEQVRFTMRMFITPIQPHFVPPTDSQELIQIIYENRPFTVSLHCLNASKQSIAYQDIQITIFDYFTKHRRVQVAIKPDETLLVHERINKEGVIEPMYFPICLCYKVLPLDKGLKDQSIRFQLMQDFFKRKYNPQSFGFSKSIFELINENAANFRPETIQQAQITTNLILHQGFSSREEDIKQKLEVMGNICYYTDEVSFMHAVLKLKKNSPTFVMLNSKNKKSYELMKAIAHARHLPTQFVQYDSLDKKDFNGAFSVRKHIKNQLKAKIVPSKFMVFEQNAFTNVTVISVDVYHQMNFSIVGFMIINQKLKKVEHKFIPIEVDNNQEEIIQEQLQLLIQTLKANSYVGGDLFIIRDAYNLTAFKARELKLWETLLPALYDNIYLYFATKRHDLRNHTNKLNRKTNQGQVMHMSCIASYWSDNEFLFTTKENAVNLLYTFFNIKGHVLTKIQQVSMMGQLSRTHYQFNEFKQSILQWLVDQNVYSLSLLNQYKKRNDIDAEVKKYLNSVKQGAHVYDYSLT